MLSVAFDALTSPPAGDPWQTGTQVYDVYYVQSTPSGAFTAPITVTDGCGAWSKNQLVVRFFVFLDQLLREQLVMRYHE